MTNTKSKHYDMMKVFATILVVIAHTTRMYTGNGVFVPIRESVGLDIVTKVIYSFHMPLYMCISGMVYGFCIDTLNKYNDTITFIKSKAIRLLIPYFAFGILYVAPIMKLLNLTNESFVSYCLNGIILGLNSRHLWFIFALFFVFVICAITKKIVQNVNPVIMMVILLAFSYISGFLPAYFAINNIFYYLFFFYVGYVVNKYYEQITKRIKHPVAICIFAVILAVLLPYENWPFRIAKAASGIGITLGFVQYVSPKMCTTRVFNKLKSSAYGVYFFHPMVIYFMFYVLHGCSINPYVLSAFIIVISYIVSYFMTWLIRKIKLGIFIGE